VENEVGFFLRQQAFYKLVVAHISEDELRLILPIVTVESASQCRNCLL